MHYSFPFSLDEHLGTLFFTKVEIQISTDRICWRQIELSKRFFSLFLLLPPTQPITEDDHVETEKLQIVDDGDANPQNRQHNVVKSGRTWRERFHAILRKSKILSTSLRKLKKKHIFFTGPAHKHEFYYVERILAHLV